MTFELTKSAKRSALFNRRPRIDTLFQIEAAECGLACLAMIAGYHGQRIGLAGLRQRYGLSEKGGNFAGLTRIAGEIGLGSRAIKLELRALGRLKTPCILHWEFNHFLVLERVKSGVAHVHDPAHGYRKIPMSEVSDKFTGVAMELWPIKGFVQHKPAPSVRLFALIGTIRDLRATFVQLLTLSVSLEVFVLAVPFYVQWTVDHVLPSADLDLMQVLGVGFLVLMLCQHAAAIARSCLLMHLSATWSARSRANIFSHLIRLPVDFFSKRHLGDLLSKFGAIDEIQRTITTAFLEGALDGLMTLLIMTLLLLYSPTLALIVLFSAALYGMLRVISYTPLRAAVQTKLIRSANQQSHFVETLRSIRAIKLFSRESHRETAWLSLLVDQINADVRVQRLALFYTHANGLLAGLENILVVWLGASYVMNGRLTVGALMAFIAYKTLFQRRIVSLIDKIAEFRTLSVQADRLADIVLATPEKTTEVTQDAEVHARCDNALAVEVKHLSFRYGNAEPLVLDNVSFTVQPGESVAITGVSGCGKSTLAQLLVGILSPTSGAVVLTNAQRTLEDVVSLRQAFGTVMQDDQLLAGSIWENISFFDPDYNRERVLSCAKLACIHDEIAGFPMRYDTLIGDMGNILSGGQKQRLLLARALYKMPSCLLLDESTSHLDIVCERHVNAAVRSLNMTRIIIAHRPETIASADRVLRLDGGKIVA